MHLCHTHFQDVGAGAGDIVVGPINPGSALLE